MVNKEISLQKAFKYLRTAELSYLEHYEKYFILYNSLNAKEYKMAIHYLWLFQKLNLSSMANIDLATTPSLPMSNLQTNDQNAFRFFSKSSAPNTESMSKTNLNDKHKLEQTMHLKAMLTIYLANNFINEAYDFMKPHLKLAKSQVANTTGSSMKQSREIVLHFFVETERFKLIKKICRLSLSDQDLMHMLLNYFEAKQDLESIALAINLHIDHRNYGRAIYLYGKYSKV